MRNVKNLTICVLMLGLLSTAAGGMTYVQYDFENIAANQGVGVPAPPSFVNSALVIASNLDITQGSGVYMLNNIYRDGVVSIGTTQQMSFQQGIPDNTVVVPEKYNFFEFSVAAVHDSVGITSISFLIFSAATPLISRTRRDLYWPR